MRLLLGSLLVCLFLFSTSLAQKKSDRELDGVVGPVKSVRSEMAYFDENGTVERIARHLSGFRSYDINGNKTEYEDFYCFGRCSYGKYTCKYDKAGRLLELTKEINGSVYKEAYEYIYDGSGRLAEIQRLNGDGVSKEVIVYDKQGRRNGSRFYNAYGSLQRKTSKRYDSEGRVVSENDGYEKKLYTAEGQVVAKIRGDDPKAHDYRKETYTYDNKGNEIKKEVFDHEGLSETDTRTYEFDEVGNWTKQATIHWNRRDGKRTWEIYRIISYY